MSHFRSSRINSLSSPGQAAGWACVSGEGGFRKGHAPSAADTWLSKHRRCRRELPAAHRLTSAKARALTRVCASARRRRLQTRGFCRFLHVFVSRLRQFKSLKSQKGQAWNGNHNSIVLFVRLRAQKVQDKWRQESFIGTNGTLGAPGLRRRKIKYVREMLDGTDETLLWTEPSKRRRVSTHAVARSVKISPRGPECHWFSALQLPAADPRPVIILK